MRSSCIGMQMLSFAQSFYDVRFSPVFWLNYIFRFQNKKQMELFIQNHLHDFDLRFFNSSKNFPPISLRIRFTWNWKCTMPFVNRFAKLFEIGASDKKYMHTNENLGYDWMNNVQSWKIYTQTWNGCRAYGLKHENGIAQSVSQKETEGQKTHGWHGAHCISMIGFHDKGKCFEPLIRLLVAFEHACKSDV